MGLETYRHYGLPVGGKTSKGTKPRKVWDRHVRDKCSSERKMCACSSLRRHIGDTLKRSPSLWKVGPVIVRRRPGRCC